MKVAVVAGFSKSLINFRGPLLKAMVDNGHEVFACAPGYSESVVNSLKKIGVKYQAIPLNRTGVNPLEDLRTLLAMRVFFEKLEPEKILLYTIKPVIYGSIAARYVGISTFSMITGVGYTFGEQSFKQKLLSFPVKRLYRYALEWNKAVFFQNPDDLKLFIDNDLVSKSGNYVLINGSGVDLNYYKRTASVTTPLVFLLIARLLRDKGIYEYVNAARLIKYEYPDVVFRLLGPFDSNPSALDRQTINKWQDEGVIEYLGETDDVRPYIAESSVYVLPSYREGTPRTVLEAMAMGRPVITTDAPGCRETVIDGKNGFLVPVKDSNALANAMKRFIENPELIPLMGEESWRIAVEKYDVRKVNSVILETMGLM